MSLALRTDFNPDATPDPDEIEIWHPTAQEWRDCVRASLEDMGVTYDELERQAQADDYQSTDARILWTMIRGTRV